MPTINVSTYYFHESLTYPVSINPFIHITFNDEHPSFRLRGRLTSIQSLPLPHLHHLFSHERFDSREREGIVGMVWLSDENQRKISFPKSYLPENLN